MKFSVTGILKTIVPLFVGVYLVWYFFSSMSPTSKNTFYEAIQVANYGWIFLSLALSFSAFAIRAYRWKYVLEPLGYQTTFWNRYHALMIGYLVNMTIPRAGEASRAAMLFRSDGVPFTKSFGTIIGERAIDLVFLGAIALLTALLGYEDFTLIFEQIQTNFGSDSAQKSDFPWKYVILGVFALCIVGMGLLMYINGKIRAKIWGIAFDVFAGLTSIFKSKNPLAYLSYSILIWVLYVVYFAVAFESLEETSHFSLSGILLAFIAGSLGITFTNGGIGVFPLLVGLVVAFKLGDTVPDGQGIGNALGMIIWTSQTALVILMGLISLVLLPKNYTKEHDTTGVSSR
jgi:uncharacterized membrane protein YbhN (UPF0104 family)